MVNPWDIESLARLEELNPPKKKRGSFVQETGQIQVDEIVVTDEVLQGLEDADPAELFKETYLAIQSGRKINMGVLNFILQKAEDNPMIYLQIHNYLSTDAKYSENLIKLAQQIVKLKSIPVGDPAAGAKVVTVSSLQNMLSKLEPIDTVLSNDTYVKKEDIEDDGQEGNKTTSDDSD